MHARRFACFALGLWLGGSLLMWWLAGQNARAAERLLDQAGPSARLQMKPLGINARLVLRYAAYEQTRTYGRAWEAGQLALGSLFFLLMLFGSREHYILLSGILLMILLVYLERLVITPEMTAQGRLLDFAPEGTPAQVRFDVLQTAYYGVEAAKFVLGLVLTGAMVFSSKRSGRSRNTRRQLNFVDKADYRRVNG
jgi:hypothetical protein